MEYTMRGESYVKTLKELTLLSKFLFDQTMDVPEAHEAALRIILGDQTLRLLTAPQTEKEIRTAPWLRSIRLDVYALDERRTVYNTEMQQEEKGDLLRRSRYYQSLIDSSLLEPGSVAFHQLNNTCIIMITPFDLFGKGKYCYTFRSYCEEDKDIELKDGAVRIFLNTKGTNDHEVSKELVDFLHYVERTDDESAQCCESENIRKIHECVKQIKDSEEMGAFL
jgi:predicted transposase/invertase (TIGR01784 family)